MKLIDIIKDTLNSKTATNYELQNKTDFVGLCAIKAFNQGFRVYNVWISFSDNSEDVNENVLALSNEDAEKEAIDRLDSRLKDFILTYGSDLQE